MLQVRFSFDAREFERAVLKTAAEAVLARLRRVRCPEHGQYASVTVSGTKVQNIKFQISGCCEALVEAATAAVAG